MTSEHRTEVTEKGLLAVFGAYKLKQGEAISRGGEVDGLTADQWSHLAASAAGKILELFPEHNRGTFTNRSQSIHVQVS